MGLTDILTTFIAGRFNIPRQAVHMFRTASRLSGLDRRTLPVELLPLNAIQMARGLLNFTVLQTLEGWVLPYWAVRQYDPASPDFVPRTHLGLSMNITHRNWTAAGHPSCPIEPIVDPRGLVTVRPDGWSIDAWLRTDAGTFFPSRATQVEQSLVEHMPVVRTRGGLGDIHLESIVYTSGQCAVMRYRVTNSSPQMVSVRLGMSVRPFNPEGISPIGEIATDPDRRTLSVNGTVGVVCDREASLTLISDRERGDVAWKFADAAIDGETTRVTCPAGLCTAVMIFDLTLPAGAGEEIVVTCPMQPDMPLAVETPDAVLAGWRDLCAHGSQCQLPPGEIADLFAASRSALIASIDGSTIRPGPATYHYFWFRDAAYMLYALDGLGYGSMTHQVFERFPESQDRSGMFRSQQGEWDSTGQAIWSVWQHTVLTHDTGLAERLFDALHAGVRWIDGKRMHEPGNVLLNGLLPRGLSAEHLGLADVYYWDMFWSLAGVEAFARLCRLLVRPEEAAVAERIASVMRHDLDRSIDAACRSVRMAAIPAGPLRRVDAGIIGSTAAWYPLQVLSSDDARMQATLHAIGSRWFMKGMFYQPFIHSGLNAYLTLHVAEGLLHMGDAEGFWRVLCDVAHHATPTWTFPEAIHPQTGGGCMGDGHHGWAAAELVLAVRHAFVHEVWGAVGAPHRIRILAGIPGSMFRQHQAFGMIGVPVPEGLLSVRVTPSGQDVTIAVTFDRVGEKMLGRWELSLPSEYEQVWVGGEQAAPVVGPFGRRIVAVAPQSLTVTARYNRMSV